VDGFVVTSSPTPLETPYLKAFHNALPTGNNRRIRKIEQSSEFPLSNNLEESVQHLFRDCWLSWHGGLPFGNQYWCTCWFLGSSGYVIG